MKKWIAQRLRFLADRIDYDGSMRHMTAVNGFTFEDGIGIVFRDDNRGCPLWFKGDEYERAHDEAGVAAEAKHLWINLGRWERVRRGMRVS